MDASRRSTWLRAVLLVGAVYLVIGIATAALANQPPSSHARVTWRLAAWAVSAVAFGTHIAYERIRLRASG